ncbi:MAG: cupin domain-containing protein [Acidimicrobiia bacterium]|nr:cupin domain-containing protein [Acidimicrobiia bacterium]
MINHGNDGGQVDDATVTITRIGEKTRALRRERGFTLQELAKLTELSPSMLSLMERGKSSPSIGSLVAVASALGVRVADLVSEEESRASQPVQRKQDQPVYETGGLRRLVVYSDESRGIEMSIIDYPVDAPSTVNRFKHSGVEFGVVLAGTLRVDVDSENYTLGEGDSIGYPSILPHRIKCAGSTAASALWVNLHLEGPR